VFQTGAWMLADPRPLSPELSRFLDTGEPPIYFGFGSMRATQDLGQVMVQTARALGRRAIVSSGWADLSLVDNEPNCLAIGEVNQQACSAGRGVAHHGGSGTTPRSLVGAPWSSCPRFRPNINDASMTRSERRTHPARHDTADRRSEHTPRCGQVAIDRRRRQRWRAVAAERLMAVGARRELVRFISGPPTDPDNRRQGLPLPSFARRLCADPT
jgi:hypothetical protein